MSIRKANLWQTTDSIPTKSADDQSASGRTYRRAARPGSLKIGTHKISRGRKIFSHGPVAPEGLRGKVNRRPSSKRDIRSNP
jgi:hypothetical protein